MTTSSKPSGNSCSKAQDAKLCSTNEPDDPHICHDCGEEMYWQECWNCGGEGGRDWEELQFEDPLWYDENDFVTVMYAKVQAAFISAIMNIAEFQLTDNMC